jgi:hypothetical protein
MNDVFSTNDGNYKPQGYMDQQWLKETMKVMTRIFCLNINIAKSNKLLQTFSKLWPPIIPK